MSQLALRAEQLQLVEHIEREAIGERTVWRVRLLEHNGAVCWSVRCVGPLARLRARALAADWCDTFGCEFIEPIAPQLRTNLIHEQIKLLRRLCAQGILIARRSHPR